MLYQGGTPRLMKLLPCAKNFFLSLTDYIFVICNLKLIKNTINTYENMRFEKKSCQKDAQYIFQAISPAPIQKIPLVRQNFAEKKKEEKKCLLILHSL